MALSLTLLTEFVSRLDGWGWKSPKTRRTREGKKQQYKMGGASLP